MKLLWEDVNFTLKDYEKAKTYIIMGFDDVNDFLDEHIVQTQAMQFSPFKKPFEEEIIQWNDELKNVSEISEEWCKLQINWMYL